MTEEEAYKTLELVAAAFPAQPWSEETLRVWSKPLMALVRDPREARAGLGVLLTRFGKDRPLRCDDLVSAVRDYQAQRRADERRAAAEIEEQAKARALPARAARRPVYPRAAGETVLAVVAEMQRRAKAGLPPLNNEALDRIAADDFERRVRVQDEREEAERREREEQLARVRADEHDHGTVMCREEPGR